MPTSTDGIELGANYHSVKSAILLNADDLINMIKVRSKLRIVRVVSRPSPRIIDLRPAELILGDF
jgi:hypothetical protein